MYLAEHKKHFCQKTAREPRIHSRQSSFAVSDALQSRRKDNLSSRNGKGEYYWQLATFRHFMQPIRYKAFQGENPPRSSLDFIKFKYDKKSHISVKNVVAVSMRRVSVDIQPVLEWRNFCSLRIPDTSRQSFRETRLESWARLLFFISQHPLGLQAQLITKKFLGYSSLQKQHFLITGIL